MKTKKVCVILALASALSCVNAASVDDFLGGIKDSILGKLDEQFDGLFKEGLGFLEACYGTETDINFDNTDFCSIADEVDKLKLNVCGLFGGSGNKNLGITGAKDFARIRQRNLQNMKAKKAVEALEYASLDTENNDLSAKLPNGKTLSQFYKTWDIHSVLNSDSTNNVVKNYLLNGNTEAVNMFMEASKYLNKDVSQLTIEDLEAPATLEDYKKGVDDNVKSYKNLIKSTNSSNASSLINAKIEAGEVANESSKEVTKTLKKEFDLAKNAEISMSLANSSYKKIPIPTQEYVLSLRKDLQPEAIAQIRKQQAFESAKIVEIEEKWNKKYELAKLIAEKEVIMAQKFDEASAKSEIDNLVNSVQ